jgi:hypothetical protein
MFIADAFFTFAGGAGYEIGCVLWVHYSERGDAAKTALWAAVLASCQVCGVAESVHDWRFAPFFVAGYAFGSFVGVKWKRAMVSVTTMTTRASLASP